MISNSPTSFFCLALFKRAFSSQAISELFSSCESLTIPVVFCSSTLISSNNAYPSHERLRASKNRNVFMTNSLYLKEKYNAQVRFEKVYFFYSLRHWIKCSLCDNV